MTSKITIVTVDAKNQLIMVKNSGITHLSMDIKLRQPERNQGFDSWDGTIEVLRNRGCSQLSGLSLSTPRGRIKSILS